MILKLIQRLFFFFAYHLYAKPKITRNDEIELLGFSLTIPPTVFHPALYFSSKFLGEYVEKLDLNGKYILDMGCGSGILSLVAAKRGALVTAIDINEQAVIATQINAIKNKLSHNIRAIHGNLFEPFTNTTTYDFVIFNPPFYLGEPQNIHEHAWKAGNDYNTIQRFANNAVQYLHQKGKIILILSSTMDVNRVLRIFSDIGFMYSSRKSKKVLFETLLIYEFNNHS